MTLIRQVVRDLVKDAGWVIFYGFLTAVSIMAFVLVGLSYQHVASQNDAIRRFTQNDVSMVRVKDLSSLMTAADRKTTAQPISTGSGRQQGLVDLFQKHDNLGSLVLLPGIGGYQQTIVYVGAYTRLTAFPFPAGSDAPIAAVSPDCAGDEGKTLRIGDHECTVTVVPSDMDVYHPLHYSPPASENLKKTLYVFSPSCEDALSLAAFPHVSVDMFIDRLILAEPTEESAADVRSFLYQNYSAYAEIQSTENFLRLSRRKQHPHPSGVSSVLHHVHAGFIRCAAAERLSHPATQDPGICGASSVWRNTAVYLCKDVSVRVGIPCDPACGYAPDPVIEQARVAAESSHGIRSHHGLGVPCHRYCAAAFCI